MKFIRIISFSFILFISSLLVGCSSAPSSETHPESVTTIKSSTIETTEPSSTAKVNYDKAELEQYYNNNLKYSKPASVSISDKGTCIVSLSLDNEHSSLKMYYADFAKNAVDISKKLSEDYEINDMFIILNFYIDSYSTCIWHTNDFGKTGYFCEEMEVANYKNTQNYSLNELVEFYEQYK